jgi:tetratricopeptide (TPR) repeat protein
VGRELGVRYVLEGSVRKGGNQLRINAQLVEAETGNHLWAERYDGEMADVFDLQDRITEGVVGAVEPSVRQAEVERSRRKRPDSLGAYDLYLQALQHAWTFSSDATTRAIELLEQALTVDPTYAAAHGLAALCHHRRNRYGGSDTADRAAGLRHARAVLAHGTDDSAALAQAAFVLAVLERDYDTALDAVREAMALTPNSAMVLMFSATVHAFAGQFDSAIEQGERSLRLSPFDPIRYQAYVAIAYAHFFSDRFEEAAKSAQRAVHCDAHFGPGFAALAASLACLGRTNEARSTVNQLLALSPSMRVSDYVGARRFAPENNEKFAAALLKAGLPE